MHQLNCIETEIIGMHMVRTCTSCTFRHKALISADWDYRRADVVWNAMAHAQDSSIAQQSSCNTLIY